MSKLAIQGLLAITTAIWLPGQADTSSRSAWSGDPTTETRLNADDAAENSPALIRPATPVDGND
ncbi:hypothetical protein ACLD02_05740 [Alloalcanivorax sp. C16-2]|uniref:hypothetical protein n=1 Tax=Alloalcanivorax TaxID=3020832 RepID=UPI0019327FDD|nr:hypothetical protein [Alloalcanivorax marinus]MBL7251540.1 hypothetical protein [Alloalcanivorax marinus]